MEELFPSLATQCRCGPPTAVKAVAPDSSTRQARPRTSRAGRKISKAELEQPVGATRLCNLGCIFEPFMNAVRQLYDFFPLSTACWPTRCRRRYHRPGRRPLRSLLGRPSRSASAVYSPDRSGTGATRRCAADPVGSRSRGTVPATTKSTRQSAASPSPFLCRRTGAGRVVHAVRPQVDQGRRPAKTTVGEELYIGADAFVDGRDQRSGATSGTATTRRPNGPACRCRPRSTIAGMPPCL